VNTRKRRPVHSLLASEKPEPETAEQREKRSREYVLHTLRGFTPEQRKIARASGILLKKNDAKKTSGRPRKDANRRDLLQMYGAHRRAGFKYEENVAMLARAFRLSESRIRNLLTEVLPKRASKK